MLLTEPNVYVEILPTRKTISSSYDINYSIDVLETIELEISSWNNYFILLLVYDNKKKGLITHVSKI